MPIPPIIVGEGLAMIGSLIDRAALTALGAAGLYAAFLRAGAGIPASGVMTFVCAILMRYVWQNRPGKRGISAARVAASLMDIVLRGDEAALRALSEGDAAAVLLRHPDDALTLSDVFSLWREVGDGAVVVASCSLDEAAARFAKSRRMEIVDKKALLKRIQRTGIGLAEEPPRPSVHKRVARAWGGIRPRPRMFACGVGLLAAYLATGRALCLACGLLVLSVAGVKVIGRYA